MLDEATASVDKKTDALIQSTLAQLKGAAMLTIASNLIQTLTLTKGMIIIMVACNPHSDSNPNSNPES